MPNVTRDDIYLNLRCAACHNELIVIPAHGLRVQHEDAECEAHHDPTLNIPSCIHCSKLIHALISPDGLVWVDHETGGDVCGWDGGNEPHETHHGHATPDTSKSLSVRRNKVGKTLSLLVEGNIHADFERMLPLARRLLLQLGGPHAFAGEIAPDTDTPNTPTTKEPTQ